jgi:peptidoglycan/LPS O-acetylase OafA/YrhL
MDKVRRYDLDWLRVFGVLLVIIFHSLMIFILEPWAVVYIKDTEYVHSFKVISI